MHAAIAYCLSALLLALCGCGGASSHMAISERHVSEEAARLAERHVLNETIEVLDEESLSVYGILADGYGTPLPRSLVTYLVGDGESVSALTEDDGSFSLTFPRDADSGRRLAVVSWIAGASPEANADLIADIGDAFERRTHAESLIADGGVISTKSDSRAESIPGFAELVESANGTYDSDADRCEFEWEAETDFYAPEAPSSGRLSEWEEDYFITHSWSVYGKALLCMEAGDIIVINGERCIVDGYFDISKGGYDTDVRYFAGDDSHVFQTCIPDTEYNHIVFASSSSS